MKLLFQLLLYLVYTQAFLNVRSNLPSRRSFLSDNISSFDAHATPLSAPELVSSSLTDTISDYVSSFRELLGSLWLTPLLCCAAAPLLLAALQGIGAVIQFRRKYATAPPPKVPVHGLVVPHPNVTKELRLLVIGDSLAVGIGQSVSATPILPTVIASSIAHATESSVYWTCFGETGASTSWIIRMIEQSNIKYDDDWKVESEEQEDPTDTEYRSFPATINDGVSYPPSNSTLLDYKRQLGEYQQTFREMYFDPESWGCFDVVVLLTGSNDLKAMLFPFLLDQEDRELRRQLRNHDNGVVGNVQLFMEILNRKMQRGIEKTTQRLIESTEALSKSVNRNMEQMERLVLNKDDDKVLEFGFKVKGEQASNSSTPTVSTATAINEPNFVEPLFALPGAPVRLVPTFRQAPLQWFAQPVFDALDNSKRRLENDGILFVDNPSLDDAIAYEDRKGHLWQARESEQLWLQLSTVSKDEQVRVQSRMKDYYASTGRPFDTVHSLDSPSQWPGKAGVNLFSADGIHPNEAGYDMWGRHIGLAVAERLQSTKKGQSHCLGS